MWIQPTAILTCNNQKSLVVLAVLGLLSFPIWFPGDGSPQDTGSLCPRTHSLCICNWNWSRLLRRHNTADEWCHWIQTKTKDWLTVTEYWLFRDVVFNVLYINYKPASPTSSKTKSGSNKRLLMEDHLAQFSRSHAPFWLASLHLLEGNLIDKCLYKNFITE